MWIRSQDKEELIECKSFEILDYENESVFVVWSNKNWLGQYSTKEKALKVLDMIQEAIKGKSQTNWTSSNIKVIEYYNNESLVFQMPQDESL